MRFRGVETRGLGRRERRAFSTISEYLERVKTPTSVSTTPSVSVVSKASDQLGRVKFVRSDLAGTVTYLEPPDADTLLVMRFTGTPTLATGGNLVLNTSFTPGTNGVIVFVSDGTRLYEIARNMGSSFFDCPVVINEDGHPCEPVLRVETDTLDEFIYVSGTAVAGRGQLRIGTEGAPSDNTFAAVVGGPAQEATTRPGLLVQGRHITAFAVAGAYGAGGDDALEVDTTQGNVVMRVNGDVSIREQLRMGSGDSTISANQNPWTLPDTSIVRLASDVDGRLIRSIVADVQDTAGGTLLYDIINVGTHFVSFVHEDAGATAANRIIASANAQPFDLMPSDTCRVWYDPGSARWRVLK